MRILLVFSYLESFSAGCLLLKARVTIDQF